MAEASVHIPDLSATSTVPLTEEYAGVFGFQLDLEGLSELPDVSFSKIPNKVYCCQSVSFPVLMNVSFPLPSGSIIRAMAVFRDPEYAAEVVTCCPHHAQLLRDSGDVAHAEHLIQVERNDQAEYFSDPETKQHSVTVPFEELSKSTTVWYKFMCYKRCFVNMNQHSLLTIITLESPRGQVVGRRCFEVEIYPKAEQTCPKIKECVIINISRQEEKIHHLKQEEFEEELEFLLLPLQDENTPAPLPSSAQLDPKKERKRSSTQGLTPYPFAKEKCLCVREKGCSEIQPTLVLDANRTLKTYRIHIPEAGTFLCSVTDLKFEVRAAVTIEYTYSSWSQHLSEFVEPDWIVAGPVFDIHADPADVAAVHLPHFICLQGGNTDTSEMKIAHIANEGIMLEKPSHISPFHAVLENPSFSLLGVLINPIYKLFPIHSVVQLYKICKKTTTLHLYLIPNDASLIQSIKEEEEKYNSILVRKHPQTDEPLYFGSRYHICSSAEVTVNPKELEFSYKRPEQLQSFMEIYLRNCRRINLSLKNKDNSVWDAWLEQEDLQILTTTTVKELRIKQVSYDPGTHHQEKELHFIEVHREALIQRTVNVEGIMDMLYGNGILDLEQYQKVLSRGTNQEKMRELYQFVPSWNYSCKDQCYEALKVKNRFLIEDLEEKD